jgi:armadillo repeat-containing protein 2
LDVLRRQVDKLPLVVRLVFVLGSLTSSEEEHRIKIFEVEGALDLLLSLLVTHVDELLRAMAEAKGGGRRGEGKGEGAAALVMNHPSQDLLVKLVRLLAHLAISSEVGPEMGKSPHVEAMLRLLENVSIQETEELLLNTVSLVTNLTYYASSSSVLWDRRMQLLPLLAEMLFVENHEAVLEAARAFGNLSRCPQARKKMQDTRVDEALVMLLDHSDSQV